MMDLHYIFPAGLYGASKSAQEKLSEGLRLELQSYGVKVISVVAGAVESNMAASAVPFHLPEGSFFKASEKEAERQAAGKQMYKVMPAAVFAQKVVGDVLSGATGRVYRGARASFVWFLSSWVPQFLQVRASGFDRLNWFTRADVGSSYRTSSSWPRKGAVSKGRRRVQ
jgi:short-subunit dehydrogenase